MLAHAAAGPLTPGVGAKGPQHSQHESSVPRGKAGALIKAVRESTERFRDVAAAENEGYALMFGCVSGPATGRWASTT